MTATISAQLAQIGIKTPTSLIYNPSYDELYAAETQTTLDGYEKGTVTNLGAVAVDTGIFTGRSPKDKYIVKDDITRDTLWWADQGKNDNKAISQETWNHLKQCVTSRLSQQKLFVIDVFCGASEATRLQVRFVTEVAWQAHFVKNMFIRPTDNELTDFNPDFWVLNGAKTTNSQWRQQGLNSENFVAHLEYHL